VVDHSTASKSLSAVKKVLRKFRLCVIPVNTGGYRVDALANYNKRWAVEKRSKNKKKIKRPKISKTLEKTEKFEKIGEDTQIQTRCSRLQRWRCGCKFKSRT
jgi:hypothetical protein